MESTAINSKPFDPKQLPPQDRKAWYESELARLQLEEIQGKDDDMLKDLLKAADFFKSIMDRQPPGLLKHPAFDEDVRQTKHYRNAAEVISRVEAKVFPGRTEIAKSK